MEIGSEFSTNSAPAGENKYLSLCSAPSRFVLSGRTGLSLIAEELRPLVSNIALPDYCCASMVAPFVAQGFHVSFYGALDPEVPSISSKAQAVLIMDYFGFLSPGTMALVSKCKQDGKLVIVDATQSAFSHSPAYEQADYVVVSYRKWLDSLCAVVYSKNGFHTPAYTEEHPTYGETWRNAAERKHRYLTCSEGKKDVFLEEYAKANRSLETDYAGYRAAASEITRLQKADSSYIRDRRRENAAFLMGEVKRLSAVSDVQLLFEELGSEDCPLFVPILLKEPQRSALRKEFIQNSIYCPIHWPIDPQSPHRETSYHKRELSLICDQRYGPEDMKRQASILSRILTASK